MSGYVAVYIGKDGAAHSPARRYQSIGAALEYLDTVVIGSGIILAVGEDGELTPAAVSRGNGEVLSGFTHSARFSDGPEYAAAEVSAAKPQTMAEMFPTGRTIFYEGSNPSRFRMEMINQFGFDPAGRGHMARGVLDGTPYDGWQRKHGWAFHCPAQHLDAIYSSGRWPMGS